MEESNFGEFRVKELIGTNGVFNEFMRAFDLPILKYMSNEGKKIGPEIRDYYNINVAGKTFLLSLKDELQMFREDYYENKSAVEIARRINLDVDVVFNYVKMRTYSQEGHRMSTVQTNNSFSDFNKNSEVSFLSSFQILRDIQMDKRFKLLRSRIIPIEKSVIDKEEQREEEITDYDFFDD